MTKYIKIFVSIHEFFSRYIAYINTKISISKHRYIAWESFTYIDITSLGGPIIIKKNSTVLCVYWLITVINNYLIVILQNTFLLINLHSVHMERSHWGDPHVFRPDRFLDANNKFVKDDHLILFGFGECDTSSLSLFKGWFTQKYIYIFYQSKY